MEKNILTQEEQTLLLRHGFTKGDVYDGRGEGQNARKIGAEQSCSNLILRDPSARNCGHRLTTRGHHCILCNPAAPGFQQRYYRKGCVYILGSPKASILKIGFAEEVHARVEGLRAGAHAGLSDWVLLFYLNSEDAGQIERGAHTILRPFLEEIQYWKDGKLQLTRETFRCKFSVALDAIATVMKREDFAYIGKPIRLPDFRKFN